MQPLLNNGTGDDAGKVGKADDNTVEAGSDADKGSSDAAPAAAPSADDSAFAPAPDFGSDDSDNEKSELVGRLEDLFGSLLSKVEHLEHMVKKLLHRH